MLAGFSRSGDNLLFARGASAKRGRRGGAARGRRRREREGRQRHHGATALHIACQKGHTEVVTKLLAANADVEKADNDGHATVPLPGGHRGCRAAARHPRTSHRATAARRERLIDAKLLAATPTRTGGQLGDTPMLLACYRPPRHRPAPLLRRQPHLRFPRRSTRRSTSPPTAATPTSSPFSSAPPLVDAAPPPRAPHARARARAAARRRRHPRRRRARRADAALARAGPGGGGRRGGGHGGVPRPRGGEAVEPQDAQVLPGAGARAPSSSGRGASASRGCLTSLARSRRCRRVDGVVMPHEVTRDYEPPTRPQSPRDGCVMPPHVHPGFSRDIFVRHTHRLTPLWHDRVYTHAVRYTHALEARIVRELHHDAAAAGVRRPEVVHRLGRRLERRLGRRQRRRAVHRRLEEARQRGRRLGRRLLR